MERYVGHSSTGRRETPRAVEGLNATDQVTVLTVAAESKSAAIGVVVDRSECGNVVDSLDIQAKRTALRRIYGELLDEVASQGKFDNFAGVGRVRIDRIVTADQQMTIWRHGHSQRTMQMGIVFVEHAACSLIFVRGGGVMEDKDFIVRRGGNIEIASFWIVDKASWGIHERNRVTLVRVSRTDLDGVLHDLRAGPRKVQAGDCPLNPFATKSFALLPLSMIAESHGPSMYLFAIRPRSLPQALITRMDPERAVGAGPVAGGEITY